MPSSTNDYVIHIGKNDSAGPVGRYFAIKDPSIDLLKIYDDGGVDIQGKLVVDCDLSVQSTNSGSAFITEFRGGSPLKTFIAVTQDGMSDASATEVLLRLGGMAPTGGSVGTIYWKQTGGSWTLEIRSSATTWASLSAT